MQGSNGSDYKDINLTDFVWLFMRKLARSVRNAYPIPSTSMNIDTYVGASSVLLLAWLGATYLHDIPPDRYPKLDRSSISASSADKVDQADGKLKDLNFAQH